jgi:hypothetical protein
LRRAAPAAAAAAIAAVVVVAALSGDDSPAGGSVAADGRSPRVPAASRVRVLVDLRRPSLGERMEDERLDPAAQREHIASLRSEAEALLSALRAKEVETVRPVIYGRAWSGFAVTLATDDLPAVQALGLRSEPVRRFYGATAAPGGAEPAARSHGAAATRLAAGRPGRGKPALALLDSGVDRRAAALRDRVVPGYDAVGRDRDPAPHARRERHGTAVAGVLAAELPAGERFASIRVAGRQRDAEGAPELEVATTDQLLSGLERTVDPDGDGDVEDAIPIALVGVSSPFSGFEDSPEAEATRAAAAIGTLVVAPAGNEGAAHGSFGTAGSPGAAPAALAVGALDGSEPTASAREGSAGGGAPGTPRVDVGLATGDGRAELTGALLGGGGRRPLSGRVTSLAGPSQAAPRGGARAAGGDPLEYLGVDASAKAAGRVVVVPLRAGRQRPSIAQRAVAAAGAGAVALIVCDPDSDAPPEPLPAGTTDGIAVVGLGGDDARRALELTEDDGGLAFVSKPREREAEGSMRVAASSSRGPTYGLAPKPDLVAPGTAGTLAPGGGTVFASGSSIAAARVAALAVRVRAAAPRLDARGLAAALVGTARPAGPLLAAGAGRADPSAAARAPALAEPRMVGFPPPPGGSATVTLANPGTKPVDLRLSAGLAVRGLRAVPARTSVRIAPGGRERVELRLEGTTASRSGFATGRLVARGGGGQITVPLLVPLGTPPPPKLGRLVTTEREGEVTGVRFSLGAVERAGAGTAVEPLGSLRLAIVDQRGAVARELTPPGGAPDLLPGEYAYTLPGDTDLDPGEYRFRVTARGPTGGTATAQSNPFTLR